MTDAEFEVTVRSQRGPHSIDSHGDYEGNDPGPNEGG